VIFLCGASGLLAQTLTSFLSNPFVLNMSFALNLTPAAWQLWCFSTVALTLVIALEADLMNSRIPNVLVLLALFAGCVLNTLGPANGREGMFGYFPGALGGMQALLGAAVGLALFLPMYVAGAMGAGDVKLLAALGAIAGPVEVLGMALCIAACGGVLALVMTMVRRRTALAWRNVVHIFEGALTLGLQGQRFDPVTQTALRMPYALAFALGVSGYGYWRQSGHPVLLSF
jgi:prepilin peptidase CpaA